jgi:hypothetical protein
MDEIGILRFSILFFTRIHSMSSPKKIGRRWFMRNADKVVICTTRCCPPHYFPHVIPGVNSKVTDEPCHVHVNIKRPGSWFASLIAWCRQRIHHEGFCRVIGQGWSECPHREFMLAERRRILAVRRNSSREIPIQGMDVSHAGQPSSEDAYAPGIPGG